jgi:hypothetical protein
MPAQLKQLEPPMTPERALAELRALKAKDRDEESGHIRADDILVELLKALGYTEVAEAFDDLPKWYA